jgi:hypothetical protein
MNIDPSVWLFIAFMGTVVSATHLDELRQRRQRAQRLARKTGHQPVQTGTGDPDVSARWGGTARR